ncbi:hypothetical protein ETB97_009064 [Aspergillus alliaceus]|uniref:Uncharacterized protein n=1 Tax=Petromyces alliaceus TaxID=209559 RepID=A0A8H6E159_PETAA|nr:hypothetical protein ETB97_009064 [Aspergillus burnettii]
MSDWSKLPQINGCILRMEESPNSDYNIGTLVPILYLDRVATGSKSSCEDFQVLRKLGEEPPSQVTD